MEETPARQGFLTCPANPIYHYARSERLSLCGDILIVTDSGHRRRREDWNFVIDKPTRQFTALCSACDRIVTGKPAPEPPELCLIPRYMPTTIIP